jgi:hypothetical protein
MRDSTLAFAKEGLHAMSGSIHAYKHVSYLTQPSKSPTRTVFSDVKIAATDIL